MSACPNCTAPASADAPFCEVCGLEFATGKLPTAPPPPEPIAGAPAKSGVDDSGWFVVIEADRAFFDSTRTDSPNVTIAFPSDPVAVEIPLRGARLLIGRRVDEDNVHPDIDLGSDPGVSRRHAELHRRDDGTWAVVDLGSTNGTRVAGADEPVAPNSPVALADGATLHFGAWTRVTVRRRDASA